MTGNVTVGVDGSQENLTVVRWAAHEAELRQAPLHLSCRRTSDPVAAQAVAGPRPVCTSAADLLIVGCHDRYPPGPRIGHVAHTVTHRVAAHIIVVPQPPALVLISRRWLRCPLAHLTRCP
ncbi:universal stress protein [Streptomyces sp. NPDC006627]|uniref:universal stress protein n=1 Tax=Streptomyces sp. NPDC006627 TaxID=3154679 RepID=UPI0033BA1928